MDVFVYTGQGKGVAEDSFYRAPPEVPRLRERPENWHINFLAIMITSWKS
jgi:hypothetical protein